MFDKTKQKNAHKFPRLWNANRLAVCAIFCCEQCLWILSLDQFFTFLFLSSSVSILVSLFALFVNLCLHLSLSLCYLPQFFGYFVQFAVTWIFQTLSSSICVCGDALWIIGMNIKVEMLHPIKCVLNASTYYTNVIMPNEKCGTKNERH